MRAIPLPCSKESSGIGTVIPNVLFPIPSYLSSMGTSQPDGTGLSRSLGLAEITLSGIGIILGAGIYALIGTAAAGAGKRGLALLCHFCHNSPLYRALLCGTLLHVSKGRCRI